MRSPENERLNLLLFDLNAPAMDRPRPIRSIFDRAVGGADGFF
jgi:hypothetical protein